MDQSNTGNSKRFIKLGCLTILGFSLACSPSGGGSGSGSDGSGGGGGPGDLSTPGGAISMICKTEGSTKDLRKFGFPTDELYTSVELPQFLSGGLALLNGKIWVTLNDNRLLKIDKVTKKIEETIVLGTQMTRLLVYGNELIIMDAGTGSEESNRQRIFRYNTITKAHDEYKIGDITQIYDSMRVVGDELFILTTNDFTIFKLDLKSHLYATRKIGESGGYGYGSFVLDDEFAWIIDDYNNKILKVRRSTLALLSRDPLPAEAYSHMEIWKDQIFVEQLTSNTLGVISTKFPTSVNKFDIGLEPDGLVQQGQRLFVLGGSDGFGQITEVDMATKKVVQSDNGFYVDQCVIDK